MCSAYRRNEILTIHMGPDFVLANLSVDFRGQLTADEIESVIAEMDQAIKERYPQIKRIFIEAEKREGHGRISQT